MPAGGLGPDGKPKEVARLELLEEVGRTAAKLRYVGRFYTSNGIFNETAYVYLATSIACLDCSWSGSWGKLSQRRRN